MGSGRLGPSSLALWSQRLGLEQAIRHVESTASTNADLKALALEGAPHGTALVASRQTAGRGRLGRTWQSDEPHNLYLSVLARPPLTVDRVALTCLASAVAVCSELGPPFAIKWPNDVLAPDGRKVAGILAEMESDQARITWLVIGVGVNLQSAPSDVPTAVSVREVTADAPHAAELAARLVTAILANIEQVAHDPQRLLERWRALDNTLGRQVRVGERRGRAVDIELSGALVIEDERGQRQRILAGDVQMVSQRGE